MSTTTIDVEDVKINQGIADEVFNPDLSLPVGTFIYDSVTHKPMEMGENGQLQDYVPRPSGLRGTVFVYHLIWISAALIYFFTRPSDQVWWATRA